MPFPRRFPCTVSRRNSAKERRQKQAEAKVEFLEMPFLSQLAFDFPVLAEYAVSDFIVSPANQNAYMWIQQWPHWNSYGLVIHGPSGCGKTHLSHVWQVRSRATRLPILFLEETLEGKEIEAGRCYIVENLEKLNNEEALFHLLNQIKAAQGYILFTSRFSPTTLQFLLPDLRSRLNALPSVGISPPDATLLKAVLAKQFADRQLRVGTDVLDYLLLRIERSFAAAKSTVNRIDTLAMETGQAVTVPFVRKMLEPVMDFTEPQA